MAFLGKSYSLVKHERFDKWLKSAGLPDEKVAALVAEKSTVKLVQNGDSYVVTQISSKGTKNTTFKSGVEFEDSIGDDKIPIKTTYTVDGNTITQKITSPLGAATFKRVYSDDELVVTITSDKFDGEAKRYYKA